MAEAGPDTLVAQEQVPDWPAWPDYPGIGTQERAAAQPQKPVEAMLVGIGLVNLLMVILFGSVLVPLAIFFALRVPVVIFFAPPLVVVGCFVVLAVTGRALDLSALIGLLMLTGIVVTNAIVLLDLVQHKIEASADVRTSALALGGHTHVCPILMTAIAMILALIRLPLLCGGLNVASLTTDWEGSGPMKSPLAAEPADMQRQCR
jgi:multidrug efflux pump subunit AcrB